MTLTWGNDIKEEAKNVLAALLYYADYKYAKCRIKGINCYQKRKENSNSYQLTIDTKLQPLFILLCFHEFFEDKPNRLNEIESNPASLQQILNSLPLENSKGRKDKLSRLINRLIEVKILRGGSHRGSDKWRIEVELDAMSVGENLSRLEQELDKKWGEEKASTPKDISSKFKEANDTARSPDAIIQPNPFGDTGQISDPARFSGRKELLRQLFEDLSQGCSLSLVGEAQIGKSSILQMSRKLGPASLNSPQIECIYLDMQNADDEEDFFRWFCRTVGIPYCRGTELEPQLKSKGKRYILCLDEIDNMAGKESFTESQRRQLRALADGRDKPLTLVTASQVPLRDVFPDSPHRSSPLADICRQIDVKPFSGKEARNFLEERLKGTNVSFSPSEINELLVKSSCHPARLQQLAAELYRDLQTNLR